MEVKNLTERDRIFSVVSSERTRDNCHKLTYKKYYLNISKRKKIL